MKSYTNSQSRYRIKSQPSQADILQLVTRKSVSFSVGSDVTNGDHKKPNKHSFVKYLAAYPEGTNIYSAKNRLSSYTWSGPQVASLNASISPRDASNEVYNRALSKLYDRIRGNLDLSIALAERNKTVEMLRSFKKVSTFIKLANPKEWGNAWLMWQYGLRPLISDFHAAADKLVNPLKIAPTHLRQRAREITKNSDIYGMYYPGVPQKRTVTASYRTEIDVIFVFNNTVNEDLAGWSSLNPISIAWELLPYSFVVDWFINVGGYIRNVESAYLYGNQFSGGFITNTSLIEKTASVHGGHSPAAGDYVSMNNDMIIFEKAKSRGVLTSSPTPRAPSFKVDLGSSRIISGAALLAQPLRKLFGGRANPFTRY